MQSHESTERYLTTFQQHYANGAAHGPAWLKPIREAAIARFKELGFPTTRDEDWKYTSLDPIASRNFAPADGPAAVSAISLVELLARSFADADCARIVFVDGSYTPQLSSLAALPAGVRVESLAQAAQRGDAVLQARLVCQARYQENSLAVLNTAFAADGALVTIAHGCRAEKPIQLIFTASGGTSPIAAHPRNVIVCEAGSEAQIVESYSGVGAGNYFTNAVTELSVGPGAIVDHYRLQRESDNGFHIGQLEVELGRDAHLTAHAITLGGALVRNDVHVVLNGEGSHCSLNGLYLLDGKQHVDNHTEIEHTRPRASSLELYKGILSGAAHGVFNGKIVVHKDAQKTDARQTNKNLLLSENAVVNTKPQLEIYADDVKCSHGSTIGQLDRDALFYLRSRGIGAADAQSLLSYAFASDVVNRIKIQSLRARLDEYLLHRFGRS
jgi:Fe-S cluster assembly protein SufD